MDLQSAHQDLDEWFYELTIAPSRFDPQPSAHVSAGGRVIHLICVEGQRAYRKWDLNNRYAPSFCGARDKIAADLAQVLGIAIPSAVVWRDGDQLGCLQKEPSQFHQTLKTMKDALNVATDGAKREAILARLANAYDPMNVFFDVWVCNRDRHVNLGNAIVVETSTSMVVWIFDYNCSLGHRVRPWTEVHRDEHGMEIGEAPVPSIISERPEWLQKLRQQANHLQGRLSALPNETIEEVCRRAFEFYKHADSKALGLELSDRLQCRREKVGVWLWQVLGC